MEPSLRRLLAWVALVLLGTVWTVSSYLESRRPLGPMGGWTAEAPSTAVSTKETPRAAASGSRLGRARSRLPERATTG